MLYTKEITFTSGGSVANQISSKIKAARGVIHKVDILDLQISKKYYQQTWQTLLIHNL